MTRLKVSVFIILVLTGVSVFSSVWIDKECTNLMELSAYAEELYQQGNTDKATEVTKELQEKWEKFRVGATVFIRDNKLTDLDRIVARVRHLTENESEELLSELTELYHLLDLLKDSEIPKGSSLL